MLSSQVKPKAGVLCYRTESFMTVERDPVGKMSHHKATVAKAR